MDCYLDMDGLLANLFDTVSRKINRKPYLKSTEEDKTVMKRVWGSRSEFLERIGDIEELFANLEPYPTNDILVGRVVRQFGGFYICSHPSKLDREACIRGKLEWIERHVAKKYGGSFLGVSFPDRKEDYAVNADGGPNLLIDDFRPYIEAWRGAGGAGIRVRSEKFSGAGELESYLDGQFSALGFGDDAGRKREGRGRGELA